ncbi:MAG: hypothetical protein A2281_11170 [Bacteroidetes bacterium RIFOXYA12_FULL_38_20]|uniref:Lysylphosphatidylglycerol synthetase/UPF0104 n=1 Tax=Candidatus Uhrbacteria bacterium GW2011_GWF2_44_350 TaxID=1619000 RepID=A0A0G1MJB5_9BACT|nr:MAG: hypothetical protein UW63_C0001G0006 [Candidatus Uhrbacteria bacterium GW2011_GWF2_44_350]OFY78676.1 MAG: hypothetical protein A2281_11170 [Bacteroidetes bacterium RIFOXYA12_FULL_38_20]
MIENEEKEVRKIRAWRVLIPMAFGMGVVLYMLIDEYNPDVYKTLTFSLNTFIFVFLAVLMMAWRDVGYMIRLRILSEGKISWRKIFNIIILWEFSSSIAPAAIGGTSVAVIYIHKEGLSVGKSAAVVMATSFLDELYFTIMFPVLLLLIGASDLFMIAGIDSVWANSLFYFAVVGYCIKVVWMLFMGYGLFFNPRFVKNIIINVFKIWFLKRWKKSAENAGEEIILASNDLKSKPFGFWVKAFTATLLSWSGRYWVFNFLLLALMVSTPAVTDGLLSISEHFLLFARQLCMWIMMLVSPTPGGSGFAEYVFAKYMGDFIPVDNFTGTMALTWRLITYYPYLIMGVIILPRWANRVFGKK